MLQTLLMTSQYYERVGEILLCMKRIAGKMERIMRLIDPAKRQASSTGFV